MRINFSAVFLGLCAPLMICCVNSPTPPIQTEFTKADSLTDHYLSLHDSIHRVWNVMINDDNQRLESMHNLLHELVVSHPGSENLLSLKDRLHQLMRMRYTQKTMSNVDVVNEYDYAASAIMQELVSNAESMQEYSYNTTLQKLVSDIRQAEGRILAYRLEYDSIVKGYNRFIELNDDFLRQTDGTLTLEKKPTFRAVSEE